MVLGGKGRSTDLLSGASLKTEWPRAGLLRGGAGNKKHLLIVVSKTRAKSGSRRAPIPPRTIAAVLLLSSRLVEGRGWADDEKKGVP